MNAVQHVPYGVETREGITSLSTPMGAGIVSLVDTMFTENLFQ
jgi:hypothetical protein